jgi:hypothetical protein
MKLRCLNKQFSDANIVKAQIELTPALRQFMSRITSNIVAAQLALECGRTGSARESIESALKSIKEVAE